ncbi:toxin VasX [Acinetobacter guillouiae]|uniref:toxin VasX n=1 Tax=Acinetobacter TaxID=469 RepID=UPI0028D634C4|nr:toxin VasX [Acinetobacter guillouiae]
MTTDNQEYPCDFCKRDEGLQLLLARYVVVTKKGTYPENTQNDTILSTYKKNDPELQDISDEKKKINSELEFRKKRNDFYKARGTYIEGSGKPKPTEPLRTITVSASRSAKSCFESINSIVPSEGYAYGLTTLRAGYLYVFMKHMDKWHEYEISQQGFLKRIDNNDYFSETISNSQSKEPCSKTVHRARALMITIPKASEATEIYMKYSEVKWSKDKKVENKKKYKKNMNVFNVKAYLNGMGNDDRQFPITEQNLNLIKNYNLEQYVFLDSNKSSAYLQTPWTLSNVSTNFENHYNQIFDYLNFKSCSSEAIDNDEDSSVINKYDNYEVTELKDILSDNKKTRLFTGAIFCLDDYVGIIQDIASNALSVLEDTSVYTDQEKTLLDVEGLKLAFGINKDIYFTEAEKAEINKDPIFLDPSEQLSNEFGKYLKEQMQKKKTPEQIAEEEIRDKANQQKYKLQDWNKNYQSCLNDKIYSDAIKSKNEKDDQKSKKIDSLDEWALKLFMNNIINEHYFYVTERDNPKSLSGNYELSSSILEFCKALPKCLDYFVKQLYLISGNKSLISDALCCSSSDIKNSVSSYINYSNLSTIPWGDLISRTNSVISSLNSFEIAYLQSSISQFVLHLSPVAMRGIELHPNQLNPLTIMLGGYTQAPVKEGVIQAKNVSQFNNKLADLLIAYYKDTFGADVKISRDSMLSKIANDPLWNASREKLRINLPYLDVSTQNLPREKAHFINTISSMLLGNYSSDAVPNEVNTSNKLKIETEIPVNVFTDKKISFEHLVATGNFVFQSLAMYTVWTDQNLSGSEKGGRKAASLAGMGMALAEGTSMMLSKYFERKMAVGPLKNTKLFVFSKDLANATSMKHLGWRTLGALVGVVFGVFDMIGGVNAYKSGERTYGALLGFSGLTMVISSAFIFFGFATHPIGLILLAISIGLAVYALYKREKELQKWLRKSFLGDANEGMVSFGKYETQLSALNGLFK